MQKLDNKKLRDLEDFSVQVKSANFGKDSLLSLTKNLQHLFACEAATLFSVDESKRQLFTRNFSKKGFPEIRLDISVKSLAGYVAATGKPVNVNNVKDQKEVSQIHPQLSYDSNWDKKLNFDTRSIIVVPLVYKNKLNGILELINKTGINGFGSEDFFKARVLSPIMGLALAKLNELEAIGADQSVSKFPQEENIHILSQMIHSSENFEDLIKKLQRPLLNYFKVEAVTIYAADLERNEIYSKAIYGGRLKDIRVAISPRSIAGYIAMIKKPLNILDVRKLEDIKKFYPKVTFDDTWDKLSGIRTKSMLAFPLIHKDKIQGVIQFVNRINQEKFSKKDEKNAFLIGQALALALYNQQKKENFPNLSSDEKTLGGLKGNNSVYVGERRSEPSKTSIDRTKSVNIQLQREEEENILIRILENGTQYVYQEIKPDKELVKIIQDVSKIDLTTPIKPHRRKTDPKF